PAADDAKKRGGTLRIPESASPDFFDPAATLHAGSMAWGTTTVLTSLLKYDGTGKILPHMSAIPEQPDQTTYVFKLAPNIKWQNVAPANGRAFTAEDAVFGIKRFQENVAGFLYAPFLDGVDKIEAIDATSFRIVTKAPYAPLISAIANDWCVMVNKEQREKVGDDGLRKYENLVGTGPFLKDTFVPNVSGSLVRNPDYFLTGKPYLDKIEFQVVTDAAARLAAFRSHQHDVSVLWSGFTKKEADSLQQQMGNDVAIQLRRSDAFRSATFNTKTKPFSDPRVRKAVHLAIDRAAIQAAIGAGSSTIMAAVPQALPLWAIPEDELSRLPGYRAPKDQDIKDAKLLMEQAGYADGLKFEADSYPAEPLAIATQAALKAIGIDMSIKEGQTADVLAKRNSGNFTLAFASTAGGPDPDQYVYVNNATGARANYGGFSSAAVDKLAEQQRAELNLAARQKLVKELQMLLLDENPWAYTVSNLLYAASWKNVKDRVVTSGRNQWLTGDIWLDKS
ncbi:hypothetical protein AYO38_11290, partial [bacterium SCGC AG-212-C10]